MQKTCYPGTCRWGEFGEGGLLWGECNHKSFEWFDGTPVEELLCKVCVLGYSIFFSPLCPYLSLLLNDSHENYDKLCEISFH